MPYVTIPHFEFPRFNTVEAASTAATVAMQTLMTFDSAADRLALITMIPKTGTLTAIEFRTGTVSTAGATFQVQLEGVASDGTPNGTIYTANANGTVVVSTANDNVFKSVAINGGTGVTVTKGDMVAIVLTVSSGTPNTVQIAVAPNTIHNMLGDFPYLVNDTAGSWAKVTSNLCAPFVLDYGGTYEYMDGGCPINSVSSPAIGNGNERGLRFVAPAPMRVKGVRVFLSNVAAGADFRVVLYDSTPTKLIETLHNGGSGADFDGDHMVSATNDGWATFMFGATQELTKDSVYYLTVYQKTANAIAVFEGVVTDNGYLSAFTTGTVDFYLATRSGGSGAFSTNTTTVPCIQIICDGIDDGTGSGGGGLSAFGFAQ